jgi:hypothetical protein
MLQRAVGDVGIRRKTRAQRFDELIQKDGHAMIDLGFGRWRNRPYGHLCAAPQDDLFAIDSDEFMEHGETEYRRHASNENCSEAHSAHVCAVLHRHVSAGGSTLNFMNSFAAFAAVAMLASTSSAYGNSPSMDDAQRAFFNARYEAASDLALTLQGSDAGSLEAFEVRTSALHFLLRDALGNDVDKARAFKQCSTCAALLAAFLSDTAKGQADCSRAARRRPSRHERTVLSWAS